MGTTRCNFTVAAAVTRQDDTMFKTHPWSPCKLRQLIIKDTTQHNWEETSLQYTWIWNDLLGADLNVHSSMLGTEWECQHWVRSAILWWRERISVMAIVKQLTRKAGKRPGDFLWSTLPVKFGKARGGWVIQVPAWRSVSPLSIAARDWCQWRWCLNVVWAVISWHSSHSNCSFEIQNTLHNITTDTSRIKWTAENL